MSNILSSFHNRFAYSPIVDRPVLRWPGGARVAVWVVPNIEHFAFDKPGPVISPGIPGLSPDVLNYSWRDYGARVGIWRLMDILDKFNIRGTVALNSDVCEHYPQIIEAGQKLKWEWMGHGLNNNTMINGQSEPDERAMIHQVIETINNATGCRPAGWLSPALTESVNTLDLLAELGIEYVANWVNDEQPYAMNVRSGSMLSMPYSAEINDYIAFMDRKHTAEQFADSIRDQFDTLYEDSASTGRVMAICLHTFMIGHPHRARHLEKALAHIASHDDVWFATGKEIADWYRAQ